MNEYKRFTNLRDAEETVEFDVDGYITPDNYFVVTEYDVFLYNSETDNFEELRDKGIKRHYFNVFKCEDLIMKHVNKSLHLLVEVLS